jgi:hypothetical protein
MKHIFVLLLTLIVTQSHSQVTNPLLTDSIQKGSNLEPDFIKQNIIGTWKDQNSETTFKKRRYFLRYDDTKIEDYGTWKIKENKLILYSDLFPSVITYTILYFSPGMFKIQFGSSNDAEIWIANRIE